MSVTHIYIAAGVFDKITFIAITFALIIVFPGEFQLADSSSVSL